MKKAVAITLTLILFLLCTFYCTAISSVGSYGSEVKSIQTKLKNLGYYNGKIDGIFGTATKKAVLAFQKDYGLKADGIVGAKTLEALKQTSGESATDTDFQLLARIISAEARGENYIGQVAVGAVILNRVEHPSFPNTLSGVIFQNGAFSCLYDGQFYESVADSAYKAARDALNGLDPTNGAIYYYNPVTATNQWIRSRPVIVTIGNHIFCS